LEFPVQLDGMHDVVSISLLKPHRARAGSTDPAITINGELEFEVDQILDCNLLKSRRKVPSQVEFQVKWVYNAADSCYLPSDLEHCQDLLLKFLEKLPLKKRKALVKAFDPYSLARLPEHLQDLTAS
jgi:hypothetical protein